MDKGLYQWVGARVLDGWSVMVPTPRKAQWCSPPLVPLAEVNVGKGNRCLQWQERLLQSLVAKAGVTS